jgi:hypothetical protein
MKKICMLLMLAAALGLAIITTSCSTPNPGSREYIPGQGWVPMNQ